MAGQLEQTARGTTVGRKARRRSLERSMRRVRTFSFSDPSGGEPRGGAGHTIYGKQQSGVLSMVIRESSAEKKHRTLQVGAPSECENCRTPPNLAAVTKIIAGFVDL